VYNPAETDFVVMLCSHLGVYFGPKKMLKNIGIITPYQRQRRILINQLAQRFSFSQWSCNREKDVVALYRYAFYLPVMWYSI